MGDYLLLHVIGFTFVFSCLVSSTELPMFLDSSLSVLQVTPSLEVKGSPGLNQETTSLCERLYIHGNSRFGHFYKYAHSLKLIVNVSNVARETHVCFHRNFSLAIGMCSPDQWNKVSNGSWIQTMSPFFDYKILDIRVHGSSNVSLKVSTEQDWFWFMYRYLFLIIGAILFNFASTWSRSIVFYKCAIPMVGLIIFVLLLLFKVMKLVSNVKTRTRFVLYPFLLVLCCMAYYDIPYIDVYHNVLRVLEREVAKTQDGLLLCLWMVYLVWVYVMGGVVWGSFAINSDPQKLYFKTDKLIDKNTSIFMCYIIRIFATALVLQSSGDTVLAWIALIVVIVMSRLLKMITRGAQQNKLKLLPTSISKTCYGRQKWKRSRNWKYSYNLRKWQYLKNKELKYSLV